MSKKRYKSLTKAITLGLLLSAGMGYSTGVSAADPSYLWNATLEKSPGGDIYVTGGWYGTDWVSASKVPASPYNTLDYYWSFGDLAGFYEGSGEYALTVVGSHAYSLADFTVTGDVYLDSGASLSLTNMPVKGVIYGYTGDSNLSGDLTIKGATGLITDGKYSVWNTYDGPAIENIGGKITLDEAVIVSDYESGVAGGINKAAGKIDMKNNSAIYVKDGVGISTALGGLDMDQSSIVVADEPSTGTFFSSGIGVGLVVGDVNMTNHSMIEAENVGMGLVVGDVTMQSSGIGNTIDGIRPKIGLAGVLGDVNMSDESFINSTSVGMGIVLGDVSVEKGEINISKDFTGATGIGIGGVLGDVNLTKTNIKIAEDDDAETDGSGFLGGIPDMGVGLVLGDVNMKGGKITVDSGNGISMVLGSEMLGKTIDTLIENADPGALEAIAGSLDLEPSDLSNLDTIKSTLKTKVDVLITSLSSSSSLVDSVPELGNIISSLGGSVDHLLDNEKLGYAQGNVVLGGLTEEDAAKIVTKVDASALMNNFYGLPVEGLTGTKDDVQAALKENSVTITAENGAAVKDVLGSVAVYGVREKTGEDGDGNPIYKYSSKLIGQEGIKGVAGTLEGGGGVEVYGTEITTTGDAISYVGYVNTTFGFTEEDDYVKTNELGELISGAADGILRSAADNLESPLYSEVGYEGSRAQSIAEGIEVAFSYLADAQPANVTVVQSKITAVEGDGINRVTGSVTVTDSSINAENGTGLTNIGGKTTIDNSEINAKYGIKDVGGFVTEGDSVEVRNGSTITATHAGVVQVKGDVSISGSTVNVGTTGNPWRGWYDVDPATETVKGVAVGGITGDLTVTDSVITSAKGYAIQYVGYDALPPTAGYTGDVTVEHSNVYGFLGGIDRVTGDVTVTESSSITARNGAGISNVAGKTTIDNSEITAQYGIKDVGANVVAGENSVEVSNGSTITATNAGVVQVKGNVKISGSTVDVGTTGNPWRGWYDVDPDTETVKGVALGGITGDLTVTDSDIISAKGYAIQYVGYDAPTPTAGHTGNVTVENSNVYGRMGGIDSVNGDVTVTGTYKYSKPDFSDLVLGTSIIADNGNAISNVEGKVFVDGAYLKGRNGITNVHASADGYNTAVEVSRSVIEATNAGISNVDKNVELECVKIDVTGNNGNAITNVDGNLKATNVVFNTRGNIIERVDGMVELDTAHLTSRDADGINLNKTTDLKASFKNVTIDAGRDALNIADRDKVEMTGMTVVADRDGMRFDNVESVEWTASSGAGDFVDAGRKGIVATDGTNISVGAEEAGRLAVMALGENVTGLDIQNSTFNVADNVTFALKTIGDESVTSVNAYGSDAEIKFATDRIVALSTGGYVNEIPDVDTLKNHGDTSITTIDATTFVGKTIVETFVAEKYIAGTTEVKDGKYYVVDDGSVQLKKAATDGTLVGAMVVSGGDAGVVVVIGSGENREYKQIKANENVVVAFDDAADNTVFEVKNYNNSGDLRSKSYFTVGEGGAVSTIKLQRGVTYQFNGEGGTTEYRTVRNSGNMNVDTTTLGNNQIYVRDGEYFYGNNPEEKLNLTEGFAYNQTKNGWGGRKTTTYVWNGESFEEFNDRADYDATAINAERGAKVDVKTGVIAAQSNMGDATAINAETDRMTYYFSDKTSSVDAEVETVLAKTFHGDALAISGERADITLNGVKDIGAISEYENATAINAYKTDLTVKDATTDVSAYAGKTAQAVVADDSTLNIDAVKGIVATSSDGAVITTDHQGVSVVKSISLGEADIIPVPDTMDLGVVLTAGQNYLEADGTVVKWTGSAKEATDILTAGSVYKVGDNFYQATEEGKLEAITLDGNVIYQETTGSGWNAQTHNYVLVDGELKETELAYGRVYNVDEELQVWTEASGWNRHDRFTDYNSENYKAVAVDMEDSAMYLGSAEGGISALATVGNAYGIVMDNSVLAGSAEGITYDDKTITEVASDKVDNSLTDTTDKDMLDLVAEVKAGTAVVLAGDDGKYTQYISETAWGTLNPSQKAAYTLNGNGVYEVEFTKADVEAWLAEDPDNRIEYTTKKYVKSEVAQVVAVSEYANAIAMDITNDSYVGLKGVQEVTALGAGDAIAINVDESTVEIDGKVTETEKSYKPRHGRPVTWTEKTYDATITAVSTEEGDAKAVWATGSRGGVYSTVNLTNFVEISAQAVEGNANAIYLDRNVNFDLTNDKGAVTEIKAIVASEDADAQGNASALIARRDSTATLDNVKSIIAMTEDGNAVAVRGSEALIDIANVKGVATDIKAITEKGNALAIGLTDATMTVNSMGDIVAVGTGNAKAIDLKASNLYKEADKAASVDKIVAVAHKVEGVDGTGLAYGLKAIENSTALLKDVDGIYVESNLGVPEKTYDSYEEASVGSSHMNYATIVAFPEGGEGLTANTAYYIVDGEGKVQVKYATQTDVDGSVSDFASLTGFRREYTIAAGTDYQKIGGTWFGADEDGKAFLATLPQTDVLYKDGDDYKEYSTGFGGYFYTIDTPAEGTLVAISGAHPVFDEKGNLEDYGTAGVYADGSVVTLEGTNGRNTEDVNLVVNAKGYGNVAGVFADASAVTMNNYDGIYVHAAEDSAYGIDAKSGSKVVTTGEKNIWITAKGGVEGIYADDSDVTITMAQGRNTNNSIMVYSADSYAYAVDAEYGADVTIDNVNSITAGAEAWASGIYAYGDAEVTVNMAKGWDTNNTIAAYSSNYVAIAVYAAEYGADVTIDNVNSITAGAEGWAGGIYAYDDSEVAISMAKGRNTNNFVVAYSADSDAYAVAARYGADVTIDNVNSITAGTAGAEAWASGIYAYGDAEVTINMANGRNTNNTIAAYSNNYAAIAVDAEDGAKVALNNVNTIEAWGNTGDAPEADPDEHVDYVEAIYAGYGADVDVNQEDKSELFIKAVNRTGEADGVVAAYGAKVKLNNVTGIEAWGNTDDAAEDEYAAGIYAGYGADVTVAMAKGKNIDNEIKAINFAGAAYGVTAEKGATVSLKNTVDMIQAVALDSDEVSLEKGDAVAISADKSAIGRKVTYNTQKAARALFNAELVDSVDDVMTAVGDKGVAIYETEVDGGFYKQVISSDVYWNLDETEQALYEAGTEGFDGAYVTTEALNESGVVEKMKELLDEDPANNIRTLRGIVDNFSTVDYVEHVSKASVDEVLAYSEAGAAYGVTAANGAIVALKDVEFIAANGATGATAISADNSNVTIDGEVTTKTEGRGKHKHTVNEYDATVRVYAGAGAAKAVEAKNDASVTMNDFAELRATAVGGDAYGIDANGSTINVTMHDGIIAAGYLEDEEEAGATNSTNYAYGVNAYNSTVSLGGDVDTIQAAGIGEVKAIAASGSTIQGTEALYNGKPIAEAIETLIDGALASDDNGALMTELETLKSYLCYANGSFVCYVRTDHTEKNTFSTREELEAWLKENPEQRIGEKTYAAADIANIVAYSKSGAATGIEATNSFTVSLKDVELIQALGDSSAIGIDASGSTVTVDGKATVKTKGWGPFKHDVTEYNAVVEAYASNGSAKAVAAANGASVTLNDFAELSAQAINSSAYGIAANSSTVNVTMHDGVIAAGQIAYKTEGDGEAAHDVVDTEKSATYAYGVNGHSSTVSLTGVNRIVAKGKDDVYGIQANSSNVSVNMVNDWFNKSYISAESANNDAYGIFASYSGNSSTVSLTGVNRIVAKGKDEAYGIQANSSSVSVNMVNDWFNKSYISAEGADGSASGIYARSGPNASTVSLDNVYSISAKAMKDAYGIQTLSSTVKGISGDAAKVGHIYAESETSGAYGIWANYSGSSSTVSLADVNSVVAKGSFSTYGICAYSSNVSVNMADEWFKKAYISAESVNSDAYGIYANFGPSASTVSLDNVYGISAKAKNAAYGIYANGSTVAGFSGSAAKVGHIYAESESGSAYGIRATQSAGASLVKLTDVNSIEAKGSSGIYGIAAWNSDVSVNMADEWFKKAYISAESANGDAYAVYGYNSNISLTGVNSINAKGTSGIYGINASGGTVTIDGKTTKLVWNGKFGEDFAMDEVPEYAVLQAVATAGAATAINASNGVSVTLKDFAEVSASATGGNAIAIKNDGSTVNVTFNGSLLSANGSGNVVAVETINGGTTTITDAQDGMVISAINNGTGDAILVKTAGGIENKKNSVSLGTATKKAVAVVSANSGNNILLNAGNNSYTDLTLNGVDVKGEWDEAEQSFSDTVADVVVGSGANVTMNLNDSSFSGAVDKNGAGTVDMTLDENSYWGVTDDSNVNNLTLTEVVDETVVQRSMVDMRSEGNAKTKLTVDTLSGKGNIAMDINVGNDPTKGDLIEVDNADSVEMINIIPAFTGQNDADENTTVTLFTGTGADGLGVDADGDGKADKVTFNNGDNIDYGAFNYSPVVETVDNGEGGNVVVLSMVNNTIGNDPVLSAKGNAALSAIVDVEAWYMDTEALYDNMDEYNAFRPEQQVWAKYTNKKNTYDDSFQGVASNGDIDKKYSGVVVGWDNRVKHYEKTNADLYVGAMLSYGDGKYNWTGGSNEIDGKGIGLYGVYKTVKGAYVSAAMKYNKYSLEEIKGTQYGTGDNFNGEYDSNAFGLSVAAGRRFAKDLQQGFYYEPQVELGWVKYGNGSYDLDGLNIDVNSMTSFRGRLGIQAGTHKVGKKGDFSDVYAKLSLNNEFCGTNDVDMGKFASFESDQGGAWVNFAIGGRVGNMNKFNADLNMNVSRGSHDSNVGFKIGLNWMF